MIILDTNVLSELMKAAPDERVLRWTAAQPATSLYITSITQAEILHGILLLPAGKRRSAVEAAARTMFQEEFDGRILPFGSDAAQPYASLATQRRRAGRPLSAFDAQIAAIAQSIGAQIATRNVADFAGCAVKIINPWEG
ncbi:MAG: type II toxin-antitoxin system VapC family toxin [Burkholderiales bacterium]